MLLFSEKTQKISMRVLSGQQEPQNQESPRFSTERDGVRTFVFPNSSSFGIKPVSREGTERLVRSAIEYALKINCHL